MSGGWWRSEIPAMFKGLQLLARSQIGFELRQAENRLKEQCIQRLVMGGTVIDPSKPNSEASYPTDMYGSWLPPLLRDAVERAQVVAVGMKAVAELLAKGDVPGFAGQIVPKEAEEESISTSTISLKNAKSLDLSKEELEMLRKAAHENAKSLDLSKEELEMLRKAAHEVGVRHPSSSDKMLGNEISSKLTKTFYQPRLPKGYKVDIPEMREINNRERRVPSSRVARLARFGQLGLGLAVGAAAEVTRRAFTFNKVDESGTVDRVIGSGNPFMTPANAEKIVQTLCRVRGAALKLGQMLSIQDSETISPALLDIFERVRHSADFMPVRQVHRQLRRDLGEKWRDNFAEFDDKPFAAASIGQVHSARLLDGRRVAIKVQYPGVAEGIDSDIDNLVTVLNIGGLFPKGLYLENFVVVARRELKLECDYKREARAIMKFGELLANDNDFYVPKTDPNWSNFLFGRHPLSGEPRLILLDFGASRSYPKKFVDQYMHIIRAAYDLDKERLLKYSREIGFLTGYESKVMEDAHCESILILGETLASSGPFDFSKQNVTRRIHKLIPVMLEHRLKSPPEEVYSLHRKLSGSYLLAAKLKAVVSCGPLFERIYDSYKFGEEGFEDIDIDSEPEHDAPQTCTA
ncbi:Ubiquinone biosynthesis protein coq-8 [Toxocara canis]|uniref:Ubiquinone biosynthesis protein coq-8 n=2 Tax=Toxocara canis TaxID=6265 RepID=A0A0B2VSE6_TOXCA|nr:Ubiquinone biosynthesis protein coq-8 [Toxocara canis]